jgi:hypothetical protein
MEVDGVVCDFFFLPRRDVRCGQNWDGFTGVLDWLGVCCFTILDKI